MGGIGGKQVRDRWRWCRICLGIVGWGEVCWGVQGIRRWWQGVGGKRVGVVEKVENGLLRDGWVCIDTRLAVCQGFRLWVFWGIEWEEKGWAGRVWSVAQKFEMLMVGVRCRCRIGRC